MQAGQHAARSSGPPQPTKPTQGPDPASVLHHMLPSAVSKGPRPAPIFCPLPPLLGPAAIRVLALPTPGFQWAAALQSCSLASPPCRTLCYPLAPHLPSAPLRPLPPAGAVRREPAPARGGCGLPPGGPAPREERGAGGGDWRPWPVRRLQQVSPLAVVQPSWGSQPEPRPAGWRAGWLAEGQVLFVRAQAGTSDVASNGQAGHVRGRQAGTWPADAELAGQPLCRPAAEPSLPFARTATQLRLMPYPPRSPAPPRPPQLCDQEGRAALQGAGRSGHCCAPDLRGPQGRILLQAPPSVHY